MALNREVSKRLTGVRCWSNVWPMRAIVVLTTVGTEEQAKGIARELIASRLAACVNIVPGIRSVYRWRGKVCEDGEWLLVVKTVEDEFEAVSETIQELHSYDVPEILAFNVTQGEEAFLEWIETSVDKSVDLDEEEDEEDDFGFAGDEDE